MPYPQTCAICSMSREYPNTHLYYCVLWGRLMAPSSGCECWQKEEPRRSIEAQGQAEIKWGGASWQTREHEST